MDETWGLTWSRRWHAVDLDRSGERAVSHCGSYLYRQQEIRDAPHLRHLKEVVADPSKAGVCKHCEKAVRNLAGI